MLAKRAASPTQIGSTLYDRNSAGRLSQIRTPACTQMVGSLCLQQGTAVAATYTYNALGQRVSKTGTVYQYDQSGHLTSESTSAGVNQRDYVWADDQLIAIIEAGKPAVCTQSLGSICLQQTAAVPEQIHYAHLDHLGTPQVFTNQAKTITWAADYEPFGKATVTTATLTSNIRLPGQYFDTETGLHQNGFRDLAPGLGRYIESDPIGLFGGSYSTYAYANQNPVSFVDPLGLAPCPPQEDSIESVCPECIFLGVGRFAYAGMAKTIPFIARAADSSPIGQAAFAVAARNSLKELFRGGLFTGVRQPTFAEQMAKYGGDAAKVIDAAARTNAGVNAAGAAAAATGAADAAAGAHSNCGCGE